MAGRGRLSSLDLLPEEARDDLYWAIGELNRRERTQADILFELNDRLEAKGIETVSRSAFNRKAMRLAKRTMQLEERRHIYAGIAERLTPEEVSKADIVLGEFLKTLIDELLEDDGLNPKNAMELARAYKDTVMAQRHSAELRDKSEAKANAKLKEAADKVVEAVGKVKGLTAETVSAIHEQILGVKA
ncbi:phage protein Gp27 family protein [Hoeflea sp.]|uniref:phage protein Gp27 family protein n=1 Tax=Hoeflea sp. TaxID=1940281 RepID=UPI003BB19123